MAEKSKVYGLIIPKKSGPTKGTKPAQASAFNVFGDDSDEEETSKGAVAPHMQSSGASKIKRQAQIDIDKALLEDPTVYEYDAVYDEMQASKPQVGAKNMEPASKDKKPKYISGLLKAAEIKKKEEERRKERKVQKEREEEGEMYADKEKFVTSAYKQKMLEMQEEEERERRQAALEAMTDVTKQKDMSGFYRYLYRQTTGSEGTPGTGKDEDKKQETVSGEDSNRQDIKLEPHSPPANKPQKPAAASSPSSSSSSSSSNSDDSEAEATQARKTAVFSKSARLASGSNFRKRRADSTSSDSETSKDRAQSKRSSHSKFPSKSFDRNQQRNIDAPSQTFKHRRSKSKSRSPADSRIKGRTSQRSRSRDRIQREHRSRSRERKGQRLRSHSRDRQRKDHIGGRDRRGHESRSKSMDTEEKGQSSKEAKSRDKQEDKGERSSKENGTASSMTISGKEKLAIDENLRALRGASGGGTEGNSESVEIELPARQKPVDPAKKVYPHHNSADDIVEARKRYLQRKIARERERAA